MHTPTGGKKPGDRAWQMKEQLERGKVLVKAAIPFEQLVLEPSGRTPQQAVEGPCKIVYPSRFPRVTLSFA
jgi:hypothetical protein